ncbi:MAG: hypothetical protein GY947_16830 [Rhodobacteraceae bacterium]|nr:hypothetical protein [Paracoccaceae bacterium]
MDAKRLTGPGAGSIKYDLLTAMTVAGMAGSNTLQSSMTRLVALVTARYNWQRDEVTVGQRDIARMWSVNERTVKREMKRLLDAGILLRLRPGVRGRVGAYRLNYVEIWRVSKPSWALVGPDFEERMASFVPQEEVKVVRVDFSPDAEEDAVATDMAGDRGKWRRARRVLRAQDSAAFNNWYGKLVFSEYCDGVLILSAPNDFVARYVETHLSRSLVDAARATFVDLSGLRIVSVD